MTAAAPEFLQPLVRAAGRVDATELSRFVRPETGGRPSAVLILIGESPATGPDLLVIERASTLRDHAGQPAFPGGARDPGDEWPAGTALREAKEEVGLDPDSVVVLTTLPELWLPVSDFVVTPVVAWWREPHEVGVVDPAEVAKVARMPVAQLADPANRFSVRHPSGYVGPAFEVHGMLVWGFTAGLVDRVLDLAGWARPWDRRRLRELPEQAVERARRTASSDAPHDAAP